MPFDLKSLRYRLEWLGVKSLATLIPLLPRRACAALARLAGTLAFRFDARGRKVSLSNLEAAFGDRFTPAERRRIGRASYQNFARTMLDLFWAPALARPGAAARCIEFKGEEVLQWMRGKPVVVLVVHNAGFEWASLACGLLNYTGTVLTEEFKNPRLNEIFDGLRGSTGQEIITQNFSMLRMMKRIKAGTHVGLLIDLNLPPTQAATIIDAFGMKMCVTYLHSILVQRTGAHLIPMTSEPLPDGRCRVEVHPRLEIPEGATEREIAQAAWDFFEARIREKPELWMWAYKHWRFRPEGETRPYPFYANPSPKFEKLRRSLS